MNKIIALICLCIISIWIGLMNFWFTYGIWPHSWQSFTLFAICSLILSITIQRVLNSKE